MGSRGIPAVPQGHETAKEGKPAPAPVAMTASGRSVGQYAVAGSSNRRSDDVCDEESGDLQEASDEEHVNACLKCIWMIPICGGFCAPTVNPEPSCLRHFSNEYTVILAPRYMTCAPCLESAPCCIACGKAGLSCATKRRGPIMLFAFILSAIGFILNIVAVIGLSTNPGIIEYFSWAQATIEIPSGTIVELKAGPKLRVDRVHCAGDERPELCMEAALAYGFDKVDDMVFQRSRRWEDESSCERFVPGLLNNSAVDYNYQLALPQASVCLECRKVAMGSATTAILSVITQIPQMTTNLQRATTFGDVNCQATMGAATSFFGLFNGLASAAQFSGACWRNFPRTIEATSRGVIKNITIHWGPGPGFICTLIAVVLKVVDAFSHLCVRTPPARWRKPGKDIKETVDYMQLALPTDMETFGTMSSSGTETSDELSDGTDASDSKDTNARE